MSASPKIHTRVKHNKLYITVKSLECVEKASIDWGDSSVEEVKVKHGVLKACHKYANCNPSLYTVKISYTSKPTPGDSTTEVKVPRKSCSSSSDSSHKSSDSTHKSCSSKHSDKHRKPCAPCWSKPDCHPKCPKPLPVCDWKHPCGWKPLELPVPVPPTYPCYPCFKF